MATGIGSGLSALANAIFLETPSGATTPQLSTFGGLIVVFAGIALAKMSNLGEAKSRNIGESFNTNTEINIRIA